VDSNHRLTDEEVTEAYEHEDALLNLRSVLKSDPGRRFFKYLFKYFRVTDFPEVGLEGPLLHDLLGKMRAGRSIWELAAEADPHTAADLLAQIEKERYAKLYRKNPDEQGG
jgi:hypothetical protein